MREALLSLGHVRHERLLGRRLTAILDTEGCSLDAWRVITLLSDGSGHHMTEIAEHAFLPPATLTKLIDHLVDEGVAALSWPPGAQLAGAMFWLKRKTFDGSYLLLSPASRSYLPSP